MISKAFFLFPGQGAQYPGMAIDLLEASAGSEAGKKIERLFSLASDIMGKDMADLLRNSSPETLKRTDISQPAITLANLAAATYLEATPAGQGIKPLGCAGFSLGEYSALFAAGVINEEDCLLLVKERGKAMQAAIDRISAGGTEIPGMAAVIGLAPDKVESLISEWKAGGSAAIKDICAANINSPRQTVVSGSAKALAEAADLFIAAGARRFLRLPVAGPFHSPFMEPAATEFLPFLNKVAFNDPQIPFFSNVSGKRVSSGEEAKKLALAQITCAVRWTDEEAAIAAAGGIDCLLETGPGTVLQGLWKDTGNALPCYSAGTAADIKKLYE